MNDVEELCRRILDKPAPPMRDAAEVLTVVRRDARRRFHTRLAACGLAVTAMLATTAVAWSVTAPAEPLPAASPVHVTGPPLPRMPSREAVATNGTRIYQMLAGALPDGYTGRPEVGSYGTSLVFPSERAPGYGARTGLIVTTPQGVGRLVGFVVRDSTAAPSGDLCTPKVTARLDRYLGGDDAGCRVIVVDGVPIRTTHTQRAGSATRFFADGYVAINWAYESWTRHPLPDDSPFTAQRLAGLAASVRLAD